MVKELSVFEAWLYPYNFDPLKPHFYIVKLGFTGVCIIFFLFLLKTIDCWYSLEPPLTSNHNLIFKQKYDKKITHCRLICGEIFNIFEKACCLNATMKLCVYTVFRWAARSGTQGRCPNAVSTPVRQSEKHILCDLDRPKSNNRVHCRSATLANCRMISIRWPHVMFTFCFGFVFVFCYKENFNNAFNKLPNHHER